MPSDPTPLDRLRAKAVRWDSIEGTPGTNMVPLSVAESILSEVQQAHTLERDDLVMQRIAEKRDLEAEVSRLTETLSQLRPWVETIHEIGFEVGAWIPSEVAAALESPEPSSDPEPCGLGLQGICQGERAVTVWDDSPTCQRCMDELHAMAEENDR